MQENPEFAFSDQNFEFIRKLALEHTGIVLSDHKRQMVYSRLARRLRKLRMDSFDHYCDIISDMDEPEHKEFINAITTNLTAFFREPHHFEFLAKTLIPELQQRKQRRIRIWSAGCSSGDEPYSIAITLLESLPKPESWDVKILATDLDSNMLATAAQGVYEQKRIEGLTQKQRNKYFLKGRGEHEGLAAVHPDVRGLITFKQLNLLDDWPMKGPFDLIFCRNVVIYFNKDTQRVLFSRYARLLGNQGYLIIGHSESLYKVSDQFTSIGRTIYRKNP